MKKSILSPESVKKFRLERGLSQQELASILNVGVGSVSRWENGQTEPSGTAAAVLTTLVSGVTQQKPFGPSASGYAIYRLLKEHFEESPK